MVILLTYILLIQTRGLSRGFKDRQQLIWPILVGSQYIEDLHGPPKILYTYYIPLES